MNLDKKNLHWQLDGSLAQEEKCKELTPQTILKKSNKETKLNYPQQLQYILIV